LRNLLVFIFFLPITLSAQVTGYEIPEISVTDSARRDKEKSLTIKRPMILELQPEDAGELLQKLAGVNVRSYGGLGGLKTVSVRGLGSQHTAIVVDGFTVLNNQTGQVNLGQIQADNIERMYLITGTQRNLLVPASSQVMGSAVYIETFEGSFPQKKHGLRFSSKMGSYSQFDNYVSYKVGNDKMYVSVSGKYRYADGRYPYIIQNGDSVYEGIRNNNHYEDLFAGFQSGFRIGNRSLLTVGVRAYSSDQELPGAVILYSDNAFQTLRNAERKAQLAYTFSGKRWSIRGFATGTLMGVSYRDTTFLNQVGQIESQFDQTAVQAGVSAHFHVKEGWGLYAAAEQQFSTLETDQSGFGKPKRNHHISLLGSKYELGKFLLTGQLSTQFLDEENETFQREQVFRVNPFVQVEYVQTKKGTNRTISLNYRNSFRMPSFNELYYNSIGNTALKPEDANQFSLGATQSLNIKRSTGLIRLTGFYNTVKNKIVAVPTKNLFIWSMQNVGEVHVAGAEFSLEWILKFNSTWSVGLNGNYTFQNALDHTSASLPTYKDQIAYIPKHSGNADVSVYFKRVGLRFSTMANSIRYSLNENVPANEVPGFVLLDAGAFGTVKFKDHDMRIQFTCKNLLNSSYSIIRYYVMPGRMFLLTFNYALH
jgi:outer membrane cobalamin receptor